MHPSPSLRHGSRGNTTFAKGKEGKKEVDQHSYKQTNDNGEILLKILITPKTKKQKTKTQKPKNDA